MQLQRHQLTDGLRVVLSNARREAERRHNIYLDVEHLMLGLLRHPDGAVRALFEQYEVDTETLYAQIADAVGMERASTIELKGYTKAALAVLDRAQDEARALNHNLLGEGHLLISLMQEDSGVVHDMLQTLPFDADAVREALAQTPPQNSSQGNASAGMAAESAARDNARASVPDEYVLIPTRTRGKNARQRKPAGRTSSTSFSGSIPTWLWFLAGGAVIMVYLWLVVPGSSLFTFLFVLVGWVFSVTLHEFAHALVAYMGGDHTVREKGYLTFNPAKYTHPMLSIVLPLVFLALGGIGLPGGAVYIERHRLKNKWWGAAVSAAGPIANLMLAFLLAMPFIVGIVDTHEVGMNIWFEQNKDEFLRRNPDMNEGQVRDALGIPDLTIWNSPTLWTAIGFLAMLQFTAVFFNLIPIPPLDGFGILEPYLDQRTAMQLRQVGMMGIFLIFFLFMYFEPVQRAFWNTVYDSTDSVDIPGWVIDEGYNNFMFWRVDQ